MKPSTLRRFQDHTPPFVAKRARDGTKRGAGNYEPWTEAEVKALVAMRAARATLAWIAQRLGMPVTRVRDKLSALDNGGVWPRYRYKPTKRERAEAGAIGSPIEGGRPFRDNLGRCEDKWRALADAGRFESVPDRSEGEYRESMPANAREIEP